MKLKNKIEKMLSLKKEIEEVAYEEGYKTPFVVCVHTLYSDKFGIALYVNPKEEFKIIYDKDKIEISVDSGVTKDYHKEVEEYIENVLGIDKKELKW